jgi:hypothetical protein
MAMAEARVIHRSLDGRQFALSGQLDLGQPFTSVADVAVHGRLHEFTAGPASLGAEVAGALGAGGFDEELTYRGGSLLVGRARPYDRQTRLVEDLLVGVWLGGEHCLVTQLYGMTTADLLTVLRTLRITDHSDGLAVRPEAGAGSELVGPATVVKQVPGLGLLETSPLTSQHTKTLPSWSGMSTPVGELFRDTLSNGKPYFVLATPDTWTTVVPLGDSVPDQVPGLMGRLSVRTVG